MTPRPRGRARPAPGDSREARPRRPGRRARRFLLACGLLLPLAAALLLTGRPASAAESARPAAQVAAAPSRAAAPATLTSAAAGKGICSIPLVGDAGNLLQLCPSNSGLYGDIAGNCAQVPAPSLPGAGLSGWLETKPSRPPAAAGTGLGGAGSNEYTLYGYAGLSWSLYNTQCILGMDYGGPVIDTTLGNYFLGAAKAYVAADNTLHDWAASPAWLSALNPLVTTSSRVLHDDLWSIWAALTLLALAVTVLVRTHRGDMAGTVTRISWALVVLALVGGLFNYPTLAGQATSALMSETLNALDAGFAGPGSQAAVAQSHDNLIVASVLYEQWVTGEIGPAYTPQAQQYGPELFKAQALTWQQAAAGPAQIAKTEKADEAQWQKIAAQVQKADPATYATLTGNQVNRAGAGLLADMLAAIECSFDIYASLVVIMALLSVMIAVIVFPGLAVVGLHYDMRHWIVGLGSRVLSLLISAVLYAAASGVDTRATIMLLSTNTVPRQAAILLLALLPVMMWILIRRVRSQSAIPRPFLIGLGFIGMRRFMRQPPAPAMPAAPAPAPVYVYVIGWPPPGGGPGGGPGPGPLPPPPPPGGGPGGPGPGPGPGPGGGGTWGGGFGGGPGGGGPGGGFRGGPGGGPTVVPSEVVPGSDTFEPWGGD